MNKDKLFPDGRTEQQLVALAAKVGDDAYSTATALIQNSQSLSLAAMQKYESPMMVAGPMIDKLLISRPELKRSQVCRAVIAAAALKYSETLAGLKTPDSVNALLPAAMVRLSDSLSDVTDSQYEESTDLYRKDLRFVVGQSVPCGAQDVDLYSAAPWTTLVKNFSITNLKRYTQAAGSGTWFRIHTDPRHTDDFNEAGWRRCYLRIAHLLESRSSVRGMIGTSWFYDPQLISVSPRLAYLQKDPLDGGAFMLRNGPGEIHTQRATLTSPSRKKLFDEGKYTPICWSVLWPRKELLSWAARQTDSLS